MVFLRERNMKDFFESIYPLVNVVNYTVMFLVLCLVVILFANLVRSLVSRYLEKSSGDIQMSLAQYAFLKHALTAVVYLVGIGLAIYLIPPLRTLSLSLFAGSGILAIIIGFAAQQSFSNIVGGIFITIFKPFRVGDRVKLMGKDVTGTIEDISLRHTVIRTFENKRVIIPNSVISTELIENSNFNDTKICKLYEIGISYDSDVDKAMEIVREEALNHPETLDNRDEDQIANNESAVNVKVLGYTDSAVTLRAWIWTKDQPAAFQLGCDLNKSIKKRFDEANIEIPYPHRTVINKL